MSLFGKLPQNRYFSQSQMPVKMVKVILTLFELEIGLDLLLNSVGLIYITMLEELVVNHENPSEWMAQIGPLIWLQSSPFRQFAPDRYTKSKWAPQHLNFRSRLEHSFDQVRIQMDLSSINNYFLTHMVVSLTVSMAIFIAGLAFLGQTSQIIGGVQMLVVYLLYCVWTIIHVNDLHDRKAAALKQVQAQYPELKLVFFQLQSCWKLIDLPEVVTVRISAR